MAGAAGLEDENAGARLGGVVRRFGRERIRRRRAGGEDAVTAQQPRERRHAYAAGGAGEEPAACLMNALEKWVHRVFSLSPVLGGEGWGEGPVAQTRCLALGPSPCPLPRVRRRGKDRTSLARVEL